MAAWAATVPVGSFFVSIDAKVAPGWDDTTFLTPETKESQLVAGQVQLAGDTGRNGLEPLV